MKAKGADGDGSYEQEAIEKDLFHIRNIQANKDPKNERSYEQIPFSSKSHGLRGSQQSLQMITRLVMRIGSQRTNTRQ